MTTLDRKNSKNFWYAFEIPVTEATTDAISNFAFELGASGCEVRKHKIIASFEAAFEPEDLLVKIKNYLHNLAELGFIIDDKIINNTIPWQDWNNTWKKNLEPFSVSKRLIIKPGWKPEPQSDQICLSIEPQMAFGTGTHPSTFMVLQFLDEIIAGGEQVMDIGTGTGILAIAAIKLGAGRAIAFDLDPIAARTAKDNCMLNQVADKVDIFCGTIDGLAETQFDLIMANISMRELTKIIFQVSKKVLPYGIVILSGLLRQEEKRITEIIKKHNFKISDKKTVEEWLTILALANA